MELRLNGYGIIEITNATLVDGGDILIEAADHFEKLAETTDYEITEVYLVELDYNWDFVAQLDVPESDWYSPHAMIIQIENQDDIQTLKAFL